LDYWDDIPFVYAGSVRHPEAILKPDTNQKARPTHMPDALAERCILFSTDAGDTVLDPFSGSGTTGTVCIKIDRRFVGVEREKEYIKLSYSRWKTTKLVSALRLKKSPDSWRLGKSSHEKG